MFDKLVKLIALALLAIFVYAHARQDGSIQGSSKYDPLLSRARLTSQPRCWSGLQLRLPIINASVVRLSSLCITSDLNVSSS